MAKKLYSANGQSVQITKETKGGKVINCGFCDMDNVIAALRQPGQTVLIKQFSDKTHGVPREEAQRLVDLWKDDISAAAERKAATNAQAEMHPNCFRGEDS
ncbi:MAG: hypothetical protein GY800_04150 [Planctomycetes bacterium]|nr:hypothetical protein [Planctomycetota bacterium]